MTPESLTALVLVDHGSRREEANAVVVEMAGRLSKLGRFARVEPAHMEIATPSLAEAFATCARNGIRKIIVVPYFLAMGSHVSADIPRLCGEAAAPHAGLEWFLSGPFGSDERLLEIILDRTTEAASRDTGAS